MARVLVGLPTLTGDIKNYKKRFDLVELRPIDHSLPRVATLRTWRKAVPPGFVFSVVLPKVVSELVPGAELDRALSEALEVATAVEARCILLQTPVSVRPTATNKKRLAAVIEALPRDGVVRAWEPSGIWEHEEALPVARSVGALLVVDAARDAPPPGPIVYTRLRAIGKGAALGATAMAELADRLRGRREAFVVVEGGDAARVKASLASALSKTRAAGASGLVVRPAVVRAEDEEQ